MNILITGISGYLGFELAKTLNNHTIVGLDIKEPNNKLPDNVIFINKSILDSELSSIIIENSVEVCIHLAWTVTPVHKKNLKRAFNVDFEGTKNIFTACKTSKIVRQIIFMSSTLAYGALPDNPEKITEKDPLRAKKSFHYAYHKRIVENEIVQPFIQNNPSIVVTVVRAPGFLGPMVNNYVAQILRSKFLPVMIGGRNTSIQFLHINDLLEFFTILIDTRTSGTFNVAPNDSVRMKDIPGMLSGLKMYVPEFIARMSVSILWFFHLYQAPGSYLDFVRYPFIASNKKAEYMLSWSPKFTTKDALESLVQKN